MKEIPSVLITKPGSLESTFSELFLNDSAINACSDVSECQQIDPTVNDWLCCDSVCKLGTSCSNGETEMPWWSVFFIMILGFFGTAFIIIAILYLCKCLKGKRSEGEIEAM